MALAAHPRTAPPRTSVSHSRSPFCPGARSHPREPLRNEARPMKRRGRSRSEHARSHPKSAPPTSDNAESYREPQDITSRVLLLAPGLDGGGAERVLARWRTHLPARGYDCVTVLTDSAGSPEPG